jgi:hypothetical protein
MPEECRAFLPAVQPCLQSIIEIACSQPGYRDSARGDGFWVAPPAEPLLFSGFLVQPMPRRSVLSPSRCLIPGAFWLAGTRHVPMDPLSLPSPGPVARSLAQSGKMSRDAMNARSATDVTAGDKHRIMQFMYEISCFCQGETAVFSHKTLMSGYPQ